MRELERVAWYRFRTGLHRQWPGYLALIAFIGIVGGLSLGSISGARRSESAFPTFLKGTDPSAMAIDVGNYNPKILAQIARLPQVTSIETYLSPNASPVNQAGYAEANSPEDQSQFDPLASLNGLFFTQDRFTVLRGRLPDPNRADEVMVDTFSASLFHWHVGQVIRYGFFSNAQLGANGLPTTPSTRIVNLRITGIGITNTEVVEDAIDRLPTMILTPALTRQLVPCCITFAWSGVRLRGGDADVPKVESEYLHLLPPGYPYYFHVTSVVENQAEQAVKPESIALAAFDGPGQVVLGAASLALLHKRVGDTVDVRGPGSSLTKLTIVGTATMPSIGVVGSSHLEMGTGALLSSTLILAGAKNVFDVNIPGPNAIFVRLKTGVAPGAGLKSLKDIVGKFPQIQSDGGSILPVERPAEILNYRTLGEVPALLGAALAVGAVAALGLTLVTSVRRRRPDLAILKTLGFTKRQLASAIAWQSSVAVVIGCAVGIPLGLALGRSLWDLFARGINAVPDPTVPALSIVLIGMAAIVLANLVALIPGRYAARTPTANLLRGE